MESMIYSNGEKRIFVMCATCRHFYASGENAGPKPIPEFYSDRHAQDAGWRLTSYPLYCPPDKEFVWICPKCASTEKR